MANKYAGTKTEKNLWEAFAGESQARNKYTYFASVAKKAGYEQIAALFLKTAENEKEHAKLWFKELGELGDTAENLLHAAPAVTSWSAPKRPTSAPCAHIRRATLRSARKTIDPVRIKKERRRRLLLRLFFIFADPFSRSPP